MNPGQFARRLTRAHLDAVDRFARAMSPERQLSDMVERQRRHATETIRETIRTRQRLLDGNDTHYPDPQTYPGDGIYITETQKE